jgi:hypothetical protein
MIDSRIIDELPYHLLVSNQLHQLALVIAGSAPMFFKLCSDANKFELYQYWRAVSMYSPAELLTTTLHDLRHLIYARQAPNSMVAANLQYCSYLTTAGKFLEDMAHYTNAAAIYEKALDEAQNRAQDAELGKI